MLELRNIEKYYNPGTINEMCLFDKFNLTVDKGEFVSVVGSNGSGKTSMLNILCGSIPVDGGQILMNGEDITTKKEFKRNQKIGHLERFHLRMHYQRYCHLQRLGHLLFLPVLS
jgi:putative tryptophan/tyrosine transport system ATP-binding protein